MSKEIKRINKVAIVGTLAETGNLIYDEKMKNKSNDKIVGAITRADFKKPAFVIDVNGQKIGVNTLPTYKKKEKDGKIVDNDRFKALEKVMEYPVGTRVKVDASIQVGKPYKTQSGNIAESVSIQMFGMSSTGVPEEDYAEGKVSGYIKSIKDETRTVDDVEEETGRLAVDFWIANYDGTISPFPLVVENDIAEGFSETYDDDDNAILSFDIVVKQVGGKKAQSAGFGRKESKVTNGFTITEYSVFDGEAALDEESEYYIDEDVFKKLFKAHEQTVKEAKNSTNNSDSTKQKGLGSARKSHVEDVEDDDCPFDD